MKTKLLSAKTLGPISATFINEMLNRAKTIFTLDDAASLYGKDKHQTGKFLSTLLKRNIICRLKAGVYLILIAGQENIQLSNWPLIARELTSGNDYYIGYYSAMRILGMTTHPLTHIYIVMSKRHRIKHFNKLTYHFIYSKPEHIWGINNYWITKQEKIFVSDLERTILEGLDRPDLCGGIKEVVRGLWSQHQKINWQKIIDYASRFHSKAALKRLGFILELLNIGNDYLPILIILISSAKDYVLLDPNGLKEGRYTSHWKLRINMNIDELQASIWE